MFKEHFRSANWLGSISGPTFCRRSDGPDLGLDCLQRFSADEKVNASMGRVYSLKQISFIT